MVVYFVDSNYYLLSNYQPTYFEVLLLRGYNNLVEQQASMKSFQNACHPYVKFMDYLIVKLTHSKPMGEKLSNFVIKEFYEFLRDGDDYYRVFYIQSNSSEVPTNEKEEMDEREYLNLLKEIIYMGDYRVTRNAKTFSLFGRTLKFDLKDKYPLLTTKRTFFRGVIEELIFFMKGNTNTKLLEEKGVNIWKGNTCKEFLDKMNLPYKEGDMGPMYGFNWNHFGADYMGSDQEYGGYNQIEKVIELIRTDPHSRRILFTTFNPVEADKGVLYPCHGLISQIYVIEKEGIKYLSLNTYQRSADAFLGLPFNIASYSALVYLFCKMLGPEYKPGELVINLGDLHIYENHLDQCIEQISREGYQFPKLNIKEFDGFDFNHLEYEHFELIGYKCHNTIKAEMVS